MFIKEKTKKDLHKLCRSIGIGIFSLIGLGSIGLCTTQQVFAVSQGTSVSWDTKEPMKKYTIVRLLEALNANPKQDIDEFLQSLVDSVSQASPDPELNNAFRNPKNEVTDVSDEKIEKLINALYGRYARQADENSKKILLGGFFRPFGDYMVDKYESQDQSWDLRRVKSEIKELQEKEKEKQKQEEDESKVEEINKQIEEHKKIYMMSAGWNDDILRYLQTENNKKRYKRLRKRMIKAGIENAIHQVRDTDNPKGLYHQVAKYVGRINCPGKGFFVGTGTLISWPDMPKELRGRVVLTCAHNYYGDPVNRLMILRDRYKGQDDDTLRNDWPLNEKLHSDIELSIGADRKIETNLGRNPDQLSFLIDLSENENDVVAYPPIAKIEGKPAHKTISAEGVYTINLEDRGYVIPDIAICILKEPAQIDEKGGCNIDYVEDDLIKDGHPKNLQAFSIGYGRTPGIDDNSSYFEKYITGQYVKKSTPCFEFGRVSIDSTRYPDLLTGHFSVYTSAITGPADSGSPFIYNKDGQYKILSVLTNTQECLLNNVVVDWIKAVADYHVKSKTSSSTASDHPGNSSQPATETK